MSAKHLSSPYTPSRVWPLSHQGEQGTVLTLCYHEILQWGWGQGKIMTPLPSAPATREWAAPCKRVLSSRSSGAWENSGPVSQNASTSPLVALIPPPMTRGFTETPARRAVYNPYTQSSSRTIGSHPLRAGAVLSTCVHFESTNHFPGNPICCSERRYHRTR